MKIARLIIFCILCFLVGMGISLLSMSLPEFIRARNIFLPTTSQTPSQTQKNDNTPVISSENSVPLMDPKFVEPVRVKALIDTKLKPLIDTDNPLNLDSPYKQTKKSILDAYAAGARDEATIQSFLYIASLENNQADYRKASAEWCQKKPTECSEVQMPIFMLGKVTDDTGNPIVGAHVFVSGEEKTASTQTDAEGKYSITFTTLNPRRIRLLVQHPEFAGGSYTFVTLDARLTLGAKNQIFNKNFTLVRAVQKVVINTVKKTVISGSATVTKEGYLIENNFSKYLIPFDSIRTPDQKIYKGNVSISTFEFNRETANEFLQSDVFSPAYSFASEGLQTYSMPLIFFYDANGKRLEVFSTYPMTVWTTNRELQALILENAQGKHDPGFNPAQYEEESSPENVAKYIALDEKKAYEASMKDPTQYPITLDWKYRNYSRLPGFFVYDQSTGLWESVGYSLVAPTTDVKHSIKSLFWTKK